MKKVVAELILFGIVIIIAFIVGSCIDKNKEEHSKGLPTNKSEYGSPYWYDDSATAKRKADDTYKRYKQSEIRNGKVVNKNKH